MYHSSDVHVCEHLAWSLMCADVGVDVDVGVGVGMDMGVYRFMHARLGMR